MRFPLMTYEQWRRHIERRGDAGFPDIVAAKRGRVVFAELKVKGRKPSPEQEKWLDTLGAGLAPSTGNDFEMPQAWEHELFLWRPSAWPTIERIAQGK